MFPIKADRVDAWTKYSKLPIGAVYVRRKPDGEVQAFNATCPHLGCFVNVAGDGFRCPCHDSRFKLDGERVNPESCPSPRNLDELEVDQEKLAKGELWVRYQAFESGKSEKIPKA